MKKFLTITLFLLITLSVNAQINNKIWEIELGKSHKNEVAKIIKSKGLKYVVDYDKYIVFSDNIPFGGSYWSMICFYFYKDVICYIEFMNDESKFPTNLFERFNYLKDTLLSKYYNYYLNNNDAFYYRFDDNKTTLILSLDGNPNKTISIRYVDNYFFSKLIESEADQL